MSTTTIKGWVVEWQHPNDGKWYPDNTQAGHDLSLVWFRKRDSLAVLPSRRAAREEMAACRRAWAEIANKPVPPFRIRRATVTLTVEASR